MSREDLRPDMDRNTDRNMDRDTDRDTDRAAGEIAEDASRQDRARRAQAPSPLRGFAVFGMVGWSIALPTVIGTLIGLWLDRSYPQSVSWTLTLLIGGAILGAVLAWRWVHRER
ncbi:MAG: AtpZ/AtpI family protein [Paracoccaceae bacterium]